MSPDVVIVDEAREREVLPLLPRLTGAVLERSSTAVMTCSGWCQTPAVHVDQTALLDASADMRQVNGVGDTGGTDRNRLGWRQGRPPDHIPLPASRPVPEGTRQQESAPRDLSDEGVEQALLDRVGAGGVLRMPLDTDHPPLVVG
jgi:hypothetical protein